MQQCALNISQCELTEKSQQFATVIYNPSSQTLDKYVRIPVVNTQYVVQDPEGIKLPTQVVPIPQGVRNIPGRFSAAKYELVFLASDIPPLGFKTYHVSQSNDGPATFLSEPIQSNTIGNDQVQLVLDSAGRITHMVTPRDTIVFKQEYLYYKGASGNNINPKHRASGAYIFRPAGGVHKFKGSTSTVYKGPLVEEVHEVVSPWVTNIVRTYATSNVIEFHWTVGPIPIE